MRRRDKQISDPNLIEMVMQKGTVVHIAMMDEDKPYQIPLNYGYKDNTLYIHSARDGKKIDLLRANNLVHFQIETGVEVKNTDQAYRCGTNYECVMGYGKATIVDNSREKKIGADILMNHYREEWGFQHRYKGCLNEVFIIRIDIDTDTVTGKKSEDKHMDVDVERFDWEEANELKIKKMDIETGQAQSAAQSVGTKGEKVKVVINGMLVDVEKKTYSFDEMIALTFDSPLTGQNVISTVSYFSGNDGKSEKIMVQGDTLEIKEWMKFNISQTDKS